MKNTLTVFTTTYNRAHLLPRLYNSLLQQTNKNFLWLVIDDGSTDNTRDLISEWINIGDIDIQYQYKNNGGMHSGHNTAYEIINTTYNVCIDSDDYMPINAVEIIHNNVQNLEDNFAGIIGLDANINGDIIGTKIPVELKHVKINELYSVHKVHGDKKLVYKTEIIKNYPKYPEYNNEKFVPLDYLYLMIDQDYDLKPVNEILCIVEYQNDGSTNNILRQYKINPNGFAFSRVSRIQFGKTFIERFKNAIHLVSSAIFARDFNWLFKTDKIHLVILALPLGVILNLYIRLKIRMK